MAEGGKVPTTASSSITELRQATFSPSSDTPGMSLVDFCVQLDDCTPTIPDAVTLHYLQKAGFSTHDPRIFRSEEDNSHMQLTDSAENSKCCELVIGLTAVEDPLEGIWRIAGWLRERIYETQLAGFFRILAKGVMTKKSHKIRISCSRPHCCLVILCPKVKWIIVTVHGIRLISLAAQKFISEIANDALQHCKMRSAGQSSRKSGKQERKFTLTLEDLAPALSEYGISIKKPSFCT